MGNAFTSTQEAPAPAPAKGADPLRDASWGTPFWNKKHLLWHRRTKPARRMVRHGERLSCNRPRIETARRAILVMRRRAAKAVRALAERCLGRRGRDRRRQTRRRG